ncbi:MAG: cell division protein FtsZ, partial [Polyangiaceae bacterium]
MSFSIEFADDQGGYDARIKVIGCGGSGGNAVNTMMNFGLEGVEFVVVNTDAQALNASLAPSKMHIGASVTRGLGAGADPEKGRKAALEDVTRLKEMLSGADMVFVTAGMGGGTGTGAAPVIAQLAREEGCLTVGVVTKPFFFEGKQRSRRAEIGLAMLAEHVDTLVTIPNQKLL